MFHQILTTPVPKAGTITPSVRALVSSLQQHKGSTAALDYVSPIHPIAAEVVGKLVNDVVAGAADDDSADTPEKSPFTVFAGYECSRVFPMDRDLREAKDYDVKRNELTIWWDGPRGTCEPQVIEVDIDHFDTDFKRAWARRRP